MVRVRAYAVDGERRVGVWVNSQFKEEVDINSQFSESQARDYLINKWQNK